MSSTGVSWHILYGSLMSRFQKDLLIVFRYRQYQELTCNLTNPILLPPVLLYQISYASKVLAYPEWMIELARSFFLYIVISTCSLIFNSCCQYHITLLFLMLCRQIHSSLIIFLDFNWIRG